MTNARHIHGPFQNHPCPWCNGELTAAGNVPGVGDGSHPVAGDPSVCIHCGGLMRFTDDAGAVERASIEDFPADMQQDLFRIMSLAQMVNRPRFEPTRSVTLILPPSASLQAGNGWSEFERIELQPGECVAFEIRAQSVPHRFVGLTCAPWDDQITRALACGRGSWRIGQAELFQATAAVPLATMIEAFAKSMVPPVPRITAVTAMCIEIRNFSDKPVGFKISIQTEIEP